jgi:oligogalacturonide transport system substrate-binding protein
MAEVLSLAMKRRTVLALGTAAMVAPWSLQAQKAARTLRFSWWGGSGRHEATLKAIALFERDNPGVRIKAEYMGFAGYLERLTTQFAGRSEPDIVQINWAWLAMFSKRGTGFRDLRQHAGAIDLDEFDAADLAYGDVAGKLNALPVSFTARVLLWNQASFNQAGVALPRHWDELFAAGRALRRARGPKAYALDGELYDMMLLSLAHIQQIHGNAYLHPLEPRVEMSKSAALEWVRTYRRLIEEEVATPLPLRASLGGAEKPTEQQPDWVVGNWAGNYTWDSVINLRRSTLNPQQQLALGDFPTAANALDSGLFGRPTLMYAVSRNSREPDIAARFVNFMATSEQAHEVLGRTRGLPGARKAFAKVRGSGKVSTLELAAFEQIAEVRRSGRLSRPSPLFEHARMHRFMREIFERVAYRKVSDEEAAQRLIDQGQALVQRIG